VPGTLTIVVDENVPYAAESFGRLGRVRRVPGRGIDPAELKDADVLIVRSVTRVGAELLDGSAVRFVGTATIGCDHVDLGYLEARGIAFASAPGSNATSVAEYVTAALLVSAQARGATLEGATMAVIGVGNVGSRVAARAEGMGLRCRLHDPPRARATRDARYLPLDDATVDADYVTLHVPLVREGRDATAGLAGRAFFAGLKPGVVFLNTSRGTITDEAALASALDAGHVSQAVLDVWQGEPAVDPAIVGRAFLATPHIAGYSFDGKVAATRMLYDAVCQWLGRDDARDLSLPLRRPTVPRIDLTAHHGSDEDALRTAVAAVYDIEADDRAFREAVAEDAAGAAFDRLRRQYPVRREVQHTTVVVDKARPSLARKAAALGFAVAR
jgi:erythronate-4-phosphate dehydrogenase